MVRETPRHGKLSAIRHAGKGLFKGLPEAVQATRYHSLVVERASLPEHFEVTAEVPEGERLGFVILRHGELEVMLQTHASVEKDDRRLAAGLRSQTSCPFRQRETGQTQLCLLSWRWSGTHHRMLMTLMCSMWMC